MAGRSSASSNLIAETYKASARKNEKLHRLWAPGNRGDQYATQSHYTRNFEGRSESSLRQVRTTERKGKTPTSQQSVNYGEAVHDQGKVLLGETKKEQQEIKR